MYALETADKTTNYGYGYGTFNGVQITSENLLQLHVQACGEENAAYEDWCRHARSLTAEWLAKGHVNDKGAAVSNLDYVKKLLTPPATMDISEARARVQIEKNLRQELGQTVLNKGSNLVARMAAHNDAGGDVVVRIPSTANRWVLWGSTKYYDVHYPVRVALPDYSDIKPQEIPTQQGPSMLAYALRIKQLELEHVRIPDMCAVHIPDTPEQCCDASQVIVQRFEPGLVRFSELKEEKRTEIIQDMGEKGITDIFKAVRFGPLFSPKMCVNPQSPIELVLTNPEQPNHTDNRKEIFFYQKGLEAAFAYPHDVGDPRVETAPGKCMSNKYYHHAAIDGLPRAYDWYIKYGTQKQQEQWEALSKKYAF
jgi:hypothetical protein